MLWFFVFPQICCQALGFLPGLRNSSLTPPLSVRFLAFFASAQWADTLVVGLPCPPKFSWNVYPSQLFSPFWRRRVPPCPLSIFFLQFVPFSVIFARNFPEMCTPHSYLRYFGIFPVICTFFQLFSLETFLKCVPLTAIFAFLASPGALSWIRAEKHVVFYVEG